MYYIVFMRVSVRARYQLELDPKSCGELQSSVCVNIVTASAESVNSIRLLLSLDWPVLYSSGPSDGKNMEQKVFGEGSLMNRYVMARFAHEYTAVIPIGNINT